MIEFEQNSILTPQQFLYSVVFLIAVLGLGYALYRRIKKDLKRIVGWKKGRTVYKKYRRPDIAMFQLMTPMEFEHWTQGLFQEIGAEASTAGKTGDHGIDVIANYRGKRIVVQCKRWFGSPITESIVRDLYGVKSSERYDLAVLVTTGQITRAAKEWAKRHKDLILIDKEDLHAIALDHNRLAVYLYSGM